MKPASSWARAAPELFYFSHTDWITVFWLHSQEHITKPKGYSQCSVWGCWSRVLFHRHRDPVSRERHRYSSRGSFLWAGETSPSRHCAQVQHRCAGAHESRWVEQNSSSAQERGHRVPVHLAGLVDREETDASGRYGCIHKCVKHGSMWLQEGVHERRFPICCLVPSWISAFPVPSICVS